MNTYLLFLTTLAATTIALAGCGEESNGTILSIVPSRIACTAAAGTCLVEVTSNATWTATVEGDGAAWCALSPGSGTGDGTVSLNVAENTATGARVTTVTFAAGSLEKTASVTQEAAVEFPPRAASTRAWIFGARLWSDIILMPECDKTSFINSTTSLQCRACSDSTGTRYYYNWPYVDQNGARLCPAPWRVPTREDLHYLGTSITTGDLRDSWGGGGFVTGTSVGGNERLYLWTSEPVPGETGRAWRLYLHAYNDGVTLEIGKGETYFGYQVRCVRSL
ncbi:MAG: hypothetical protein LBP56_09485 [Odoribacteraceae bacterium]|nr:hypothetical protein [Odoribacteraceae bacterium]